MAQGMADMAAAKNEGVDEVERRTPSNSSPTSVRAWSEAVLKPGIAN